MMTQSDLDADWAYDQHTATHRLDSAGRPEQDDCDWCNQDAQDLAAEIRAERAHGRA